MFTRITHTHTVQYTCVCVCLREKKRVQCVTFMNCRAVEIAQKVYVLHLCTIFTLINANHLSDQVALEFPLPLNAHNTQKCL